MGPAQYIISYLFNYLNNFFRLTPEFFVRLPYLFAGIITLFLACFFTSKYFGRTSCFISTFFISTSGLLIAFSKFVQYQSFVILLSIICVSIVLHKVSNKTIITAGLISGISLLFHYDSLAFILPICIFLVSNKNLKHFIIYLVSLTVTSCIFYVPYVLKPEFKSTFMYLIKTRISSSPSVDSLIYSSKIMLMYHSKEWLVLLLICFFIYCLYHFISLRKMQKVFFLLTLFLILLRVAIPQRNIFLVSFNSLSCVLYLLFYIKNNKDPLFLRLINTWFWVAFLFYGLFFSKPLTHIYTFFVPLFMLCGYYGQELIRRKYRFINLLFLYLFVITFISSVSFNFQAFADVSKEYPWNAKRYIFGNMPDLIAKRQKVDGIFGFPYFRNWREISTKIDVLGIKTYNSNEKYRLTKYYIRNFKWSDGKADVLIYIKKAQNLSLPVPERPTNREPIVSTETYEIYYLK